MKKILVCCITVLFLAVGLSAQEVDDFDDFDDFASLFDDAEDIVVEEAAPVTVESAPAGRITFTGSTSAAGGAALLYTDGAVSVLPAATFSSALAFEARVDSSTSVHGLVKAAFPGNLQFSLTNLYLDTLLGDTWVTLGKKSASWGNSRIFSGANSSLATSSGLDTGIVDSSRNPNLVDDSGKSFSVLLRRPAGPGELAVMGYVTRVITDAAHVSLDDLNAAFCFDTNLGLTGISVLGRWYSADAAESRHQAVIALEQKRTIAGVDFYAQEQVRDFSAPQVLLTAGFYRIWEEHPRMALNVEVQDEWETGTGSQKIRLGLDAGISRLGKSRSGKLVLTGWHDFSTQNGTLALGFIRNNILAHTNLVTGIKAGYDLSARTPEDFLTDATAATTLSLSISY